MSKKNSNRIGVVYSTNPDFEYEEIEELEEETLPNNQQKLYVQLDKKQRAGKQVTLITGFVGRSEDLERLGKELKNKCGVGGSVKDNEILLQGDFRQKVIDYLMKKDYKVKQRG
ncbi:MAG: translation initiation factor [Bacteroidales bacterium]|nr:translation initiation factor [Bacteroidales bacterium]MEE1225708.1 translation initiation factor [Bacteroidales bacterium]